MQDSSEDGMGAGDDLFQAVDANGGNDIFANRELLNIDHVLDQNRIVGCNKHIRELANEVDPAVTGSPPKSVILYGKTGSGKSLVANHVMERAGTRRNDVTIAWRR